MTHSTGRRGRGLLTAALATLAAFFVALAMVGCAAAPKSVQPTSQPAMLDGTSSADLDTAVARIRAFTSPAFKTPAESRLYASLGADTVGMSTATEAVTLHHMGTRVLGINCITNLATLDHDVVTSHEQVTDAAEQASEDMIALVTAAVVTVGEG